MTELLLRKSRLLALLAVLCGVSAAFAQTPVEKYGQLKIYNGKVSDKNNNPVVLRGMSLFWSGYSEGSPFYNATTVKWLRDDWCVDVVRASMSVETGGSNYVNNPSEINKIKTVIQACIDNGIYVIVDFHTHSPNYKAQAKTFFTEIATLYGNTPNVLYEPYNEPITEDWSSVIKPYHNEIIQTIRAKDPDNIIICGTKNYSQDVDVAANDPVTGTNIAYTLHYYANSHQASLRQKASNALAKGVALFVTEYGTTNASGNGGYNEAESKVWWEYLEANKLSSCNWSIGNKAETSAALVPGLNKQNNWTSGELTASGTLVRNYIKSKCNVKVTTGSITLSFAGDKVQYNQGETVTINATATVSNGTIAKMEFYSGTALIGTDATTASFSLTTTTLKSGGHNITAKTFDASGNLIAESPLYVINVVGASNVSTTGITDQFEAETQFSEITGGVISTNCTSGFGAAAAGVYWFEDRDATTAFKAEATRSGDGKLTYLVSQEQNKYNVMGFNFGEYCGAGSRKKYTLDLSKNAVLSITVSAPLTNKETLDLKFQMKDEDGTVLAINKNVLKTDGTVDGPNWYKYEIGFSKNHSTPDFVSLAPGKTYNFTFDFRNALSIKNPMSPTFPADINTNNADFDFTKVVEVVIIPVNSKDTGPNVKPAYAPLAFTDQQIIFSGLSLGNPLLGGDICTTPPAVTATTATYCQDAKNATALKATGITGLKLRWYSSSEGGTASEIAPIPSTSAPGKTTYYVSQATGNTPECEGPRKAVDVTITEAPVADAGEDKPNAVGPTVALNGNGSATGTWKLVSGPVGVTPTFSPSANAASVQVGGLNVTGEYKFSYTVTGTSPCSSAVSEVVLNVATVTNTAGALLNQNIEIYPNPAGDNLTINLSKVEGRKSIRIVDMVGRVIAESTEENTVNVKMTDLNRGMYFVEIQTEAGSIVKSVIKQ
jgi:endoglucanase